MPDCTDEQNLVDELHQARSLLLAQLAQLEGLIAPAEALLAACMSPPPAGAKPVVEPTTVEELREKARPFLPNGGGQPM